MTGCVRKFDGNTTMSFKISDKHLLKKYNQIWKRVEKLLKKEFDNKPVYGDDDKFIKTKTKIYGGSANTNFEDKKMLKEKAPCNCLSIIMLNSVIKAKIILKHIWKSKNWKSYWWWFRKCLSDNDYNDEMESDDESNE